MSHCTVQAHHPWQPPGVGEGAGSFRYTPPLLRAQLPAFPPTHEQPHPPSKGGGRSSCPRLILCTALHLIITLGPGLRSCTPWLWALLKRCESHRWKVPLPHTMMSALKSSRSHWNHTSLCRERRPPGRKARVPHAAVHRPRGRSGGARHRGVGRRGGLLRQLAQAASQLAGCGHGLLAS